MAPPVPECSAASPGESAELVEKLAAGELRVAVLLPTLNGEGDLARLIPALDRQGLAHQRFAVDSSSEDRTVERLQAGGFQVTKIERHEFGHGRTRNLLATQTDADFLVFLSQDATPVGPDFLLSLLTPFADAGIGGAIARVLPNPGDDPLTVRTVLASPEAASEGATRRWTNPEAYAAMGPAERADLLRFNNVASCIRREAWEATPFPEVPFGEDFAWAMRALAAGWALRFEPSAVVHHAHRYSPGAALARYRTDAVFHREFHGTRIRPSLLSVLKGGLYETKEDLLHLMGVSPLRAQFWSSLCVSPFLRFSQAYGQYLGSSASRSPGAEAAAWARAREAGAIGLEAVTGAPRDGEPSGGLSDAGLAPGHTPPSSHPDNQSRLAGGPS